MARPKKDEADLRRKWPVLNPTAQERASITRFAADVGLGVSAYLIGCGLRRPPSPRQDWQRIVFQQAKLLDLLEDIAASVRDRTTRIEAGLLLLAIRRVEHRIENLLPHSPHSEGDEGDCDC